jgi:hypothetical protein
LISAGDGRSPALLVSTFAYYLIEGLKGGADYTQDKIISYQDHDREDH